MRRACARSHQWWDGRRRSSAERRARRPGFDPDDPLLRLCASRWPSTLIGFPRHLSPARRRLRASTQRRLDELVPVENAAMDDRTVIEWDKDDLDALGLLKVDVLALGMLSAIARVLSTWSSAAARAGTWTLRHDAGRATRPPTT
jgi:error-prone DNA polymerase